MIELSILMLGLAIVAAIATAVALALGFERWYMSLFPIPACLLTAFLSKNE